MPSKIDHKELQLEQDLKWTERSWIIQRIGWGLLLSFVLLAALGAFGTGMLSKVHLQSGLYSVDYERFGRFQMPQEFKIMAHARNGKVVVKVPQSFTENYEISSSLPQPSQQLFDSSHIKLEYAANGSVLIMIEVEAEQTGTHNAALIINDQVFSISQFIYP
ncbi:MAG TPA: hypothetical protein VLC28_07925 [Flavitalea sp.]|nr:hypothetical protein [Flavitalea sp.]